MGIILGLAEGEVFANDAEIQKSALQVTMLGRSSGDAQHLKRLSRVLRWPMLYFNTFDIFITLHIIHVQLII